MSFDDPSLGEVYRLAQSMNANLDRVEKTVALGQQRTEAKLDRLDDKVGSLERAGQVTDADLRALAARVDEHDQFKKWAIQLVLSFVILGVLGAVFAMAGGGVQ